MPLKIRYKQVSLPFKHPFTISKGTKTHQPALVIELECFGIKGYGEAPAISYYNIPVEKMIADLEAKKAFIEKFSFTDPERFWHYVHHLFPANSFLVCALDMAGWDIYGKMKRQPLYQLWGLDPSNAPLTDYTIGIDTEEVMVKKMMEMPWPIYKVKVGMEKDVELLQSLRNHTNSKFRVDANEAWQLLQASEKIEKLSSLGVELVEQPLAKNNWEDMKILYSHSSLPLFADEACVAEQDVVKCKDHFHGINIKLTKCGGITPARRMIEKARELELRVMLGCMNERIIGSAALAHLAPLADHLDMDGQLLLQDQQGRGVEIDNGKIILNDSPGLGITLDEF